MLQATEIRRTRHIYFSREVIPLNETVHLGPLFKTIGNTLNSNITQQMQSAGLTSAQMFILHFLSRHTDIPIYQKDVEDALELSHATVAGIISRLESKGFIRLEPSEKDKRCKRIVATDKAKELDAETGRVIDETEAKMLAGFSSEEASLLREYLHRILHNMGIEIPHRPILKEDRQW